MLVAKNLSHTFHRHPVFGPLSFSIAPGSLVRLQGPNGSGKTTLMKLLVGLYPLHQGTLEVVGGQSSLKKSMEYLPSEGNGLFAPLDAITNLYFWSTLRGETHTKEKITSVLEKWKIPRTLLKLQFPVGHMSTGMRRRLSLARLSLSSAPYWILDEPTLGLDTEGQQAFIALLTSHLARNGAILLVSHDAGLLQHLPHTTLDIAYAHG